MIKKNQKGLFKKNQLYMAIFILLLLVIELIILTIFLFILENGYFEYLKSDV